MAPTSRALRPIPSIDPDDAGDPTTIDRIPWHTPSRERSEPSGVRAVPRPTPRPVPRPAARPTPPPPAPEPPRPSIVGCPAPVVEDVEWLSLPPPLREDMLAEGTRPEGQAQTRIAIIRVARTLGHDYRRHCGRTLRTDAPAIEIMQRQLVDFATRAARGQLAPGVLAREVARHGALLGELIARRLGGEWLDVSGAHPGLWTMRVPSQRVVIPIGRVYRFVVQMNREQDLMGFLLDLDAANRTRA